MNNMNNSSSSCCFALRFFVHFFLQLQRLLQFTFISDCQLIVANVVFSCLYYLLLSTLFNSRMAGPDGCALRTLMIINNNITQSSSSSSSSSSTGIQQTSTTNTNRQTICALSEVKESSLILENIYFLNFSFMFVGFIIICSSTQFYFPLIKVFRSEHRNRKFFYF